MLKCFIMYSVCVIIYSNKDDDDYYYNNLNFESLIIKVKSTTMIYTKTTNQQ